MVGHIYKIYNNFNNKVYIGQTRYSVQTRYKGHLKCVREHVNKPLYNEMNKYGIENFFVKEIEEVDVNRLNEREIYWISYYNSFNNGYNLTLGGDGKKYEWTDSQYEEIKNLYIEGFTSKKISELFNVSSDTILNILRGLGIKTNKKPFDINQEEINEVIQSYQTGTSLRKIAISYKTDVETVKRFLKSQNVDLRVKYKILEDLDIHPDIIKDFISGMRIHDIEKKYKSDCRTIKKVLYMYKIDPNLKRGLRNTTKGSFCLNDSECLEAIRLYGEKMPVKEIAKIFKVDISTIYDMLKKYKIKCNRYNYSKSTQSLK